MLFRSQMATPEMVEKEKLTAIEKALNDQKVELEKALAQVKQYEDEKKEAIVKSKTEAVKAVVKDEKQIISETSFSNSVASTLGLLRSELGDNVKILCVNNSFVSDAVSFDQSQIVLPNVLKTVCDTINNCEFVDMLGLSEIINLNSWVFTTTYPNGSIVKHKDRKSVV